jgi:hypothetical protein
VPSRGAVALVLLAVVAGCMSVPHAPPVSPAPPAASTPALRFVALGDMGTGGKDQLQVAKAIGTVCAARGCDFAVGLGDLIYPAGVKDANDPQFDTKFEQPYKGLDLPFWMVLGNHDNSQDPGGTSATGGLGLWYQSGDAEVAYAQRSDRASDKWREPARYYTMDSANGLAHFVGLDTNTLLFYGVAVPPDLGAAIQAQEDWLPGAVAAGNASWRIAMGHHPYVSNGPHGDAGDYEGRDVPGQDGDHLKQLFERDLCGKVDLYLAGHDHDLEWLQPVPACGATQFIVSGGGGADLYGLAERDTPVFQKSTHGFWWIELTPTALHAVAFDQDAQVLYDGAVPKPLGQAGAPAH